METQPFPPVVALVSSAGGLDAVERVLKALPPDFPGALIVLQHQSPDRVSHLPEILARNCCFPVHTAGEGTPLAAGKVYVVPPGQHAVVTTANTTALIATDSHWPSYRPSADLLLTSLALTAGDRAIAVVLSGSGHDGATGASALHHFGGTVIASDRQSSTHFDMPEASIQRDGAVDYIMPVEDIPALLLKLLDQ